MMHPPTGGFLCARMKPLEARGLSIFDFASLMLHTGPSLGWELRALL